MHIKPKGMRVRFNIKHVGLDLRDAETSVIVKCKMTLRKPKVMWFTWNLMLECWSVDACANRLTYCRHEAW